jgi:aryl-alcohol dehydrogenase-like predicted oxidoreductase
VETTNKSFAPFFSGEEIGIGTWAWGDRFVWGYGHGYHEPEVKSAFQEAISNGITFFDTAEVYGRGKSESLLGRLLPTSKEPVKVATKFMPFPWRLGGHALRGALLASLERLGLKKVDLYQIHWPLPPVSVESWMRQMAEVHAEGLIDAIGVSNYDLEKIKAAGEALAKAGLRLASNQVEYHLLDRKIEKNGLMQYCNENGIKIIAYSPLAMGMLSGKYTPENPPKGARAAQYPAELLARIQPLIRLLKKIGQEHEGKTAAQVALNWVICKDTFPIPGAKNARQVADNCGATGWRLTPAEIGLLDEMSDKVTSSK